MMYGIGKEIEKVKDIEMTEISAKIKVTVDGLQPLVKETIVDFSSGEEIHVSLDYDKLANHCRLCNMLTHEA